MKTPGQWCEDHYPVEANQFVCATDLECLVHSIATYEGLRKVNLPPNWSYSNWRLKQTGPKCLEIEDSSCALCQKYPSDECKNADGNFCPHQAVYRKNLLRCGIKYVDNLQSCSQ